MVTSIRIDRDVPMATRDGATLRADVYRPDDSEAHPAILVRTPYNKALSSGGFLPATDAAFAGYAFVVQDTRGRFASEGTFVPRRSEGEDGYDAVEWVAVQPWCDGRVGMSGGSYLGRIQWETALEQPPSLRAIAPAIISSGPVGEFERGGVIRFESAVSWFSMMAVEIVNRLEREGRDVTDMRTMVDRARFNIDEVLEHLPFNEVPHFDFDGLRELFLTRATDELPSNVRSEDDLFWDASRIEVPALHIGGWYDIYAGSLFDNFARMRAGAATDAARAGQHLIAGPWVHGVGPTPYVGGLHFGPTSSAIAAQVPQSCLAFFDRYVRGGDAQLPAIRYFVMGRNEWRTAEEWPPPRAEWIRLQLGSGGHASTAGGDGTLTSEREGAQAPDVFTYDPRDPVPTTGGRLLASGKLVPGPLDQSHVEQRSDVLCYTTEPLADDLEVTGPVQLHLFASTSAVDTDFVAKIVDVHPSGAAYNVAEGIVRARYRNGVFAPAPVTPGEVNEYVIDLAHTSIVFRAGHRLRLDVTSSNFPAFDRNMNTGHRFGEDREGVIATQTVCHDDSHASYLELPVIPSRIG